MHRREILAAAAPEEAGCTVSLSTTGLPFTDNTLIGQAKAGIITVSAAAALIGAMLLFTAPVGTARNSRRR